MVYSPPQPSNTMHQLLLPLTTPTPPSIFTFSHPKTPHSLKNIKISALSSSKPALQLLLPNALRRQTTPTFGSSHFTLGVDLGDARTGLALGKGYSPRPLTVLELRGDKLELRLLHIAQEQEVNEFVIGLPKSSTGKETVQSNKVRSIAGRFAVRAAQRGWRVYLQNEHGTSLDALDFMIETGQKKSARRDKIDSYAAMMVLERYFSSSGRVAELVLPKQLELQELLLKGSNQDAYLATEDAF